MHTSISTGSLRRSASLCTQKLSGCPAPETRGCTTSALFSSLTETLACLRPLRMAMASRSMDCRRAGSSSPTFTYGPDNGPPLSAAASFSTYDDSRSAALVPEISFAYDAANIADEFASSANEVNISTAMKMANAASMEKNPFLDLLCVNSDHIHVA